ncbi:dienelactone hydrolase family protein [Chthonomonas calidirosea]|uniref:dienelactone hydrolase family protein n=1 Tax=Chthonomonas calidirosea TaxID=454171 RepID=UPI0006EC4386|nr:acetylxylan esterase [Chthonomonas calidirosea]CEK13764.1 Acetyl xylan esterase (AXE1) [Chthonomonas calidirosea]
MNRTKPSRPDPRLLGPIVTTNTPRELAMPKTLEDWRKWRLFVRRRILTAAGLSPMPVRTPLYPQIFRRLEHDGYSIETVAIESLPGFWLYGNLYQPLPLPEVRQPGVLIAHGHWASGRLTDTDEASFVACGIAMARAGWTAFAYDMVGYTDTTLVSHQFALDAEEALWEISLFGLQTWNSLRALDFLLSLPHVDPDRIGMTGASGGGTQTMVLAAIDDRLKVSAPCVMVSHTMQGGCLCENAPGLRIDFSNLDIAAAHAPNPQILVGATGDWTKDTLTVEGPSIARIYDLYGRPESFRYRLLDYGHNFNEASRREVYAFMAEQFGSNAIPTDLPFPKEREEDMRAPQWARTRGMAETEIKGALRHRAVQMLEEAVRFAFKDREALHDRYFSLWQHVLAIDSPKDVDIVWEIKETESEIGGQRLQVVFGYEGRQERLEAILMEPYLHGGVWGAILVDGTAGTIGDDPFLLMLLKLGLRVLRPKRLTLNTEEERQRYEDYSRDFFCTYNRTLLQERLKDLRASIGFMKRLGVEHLVVIGREGAGLEALLMAPFVTSLIADVQHAETEQPAFWKTSDRFLPGIMRLGGTVLPLLLAASRPVYLYNVGDRFCAPEHFDELTKAYGSRLHWTRTEPSHVEIVNWIAQNLRFQLETG